MHLKAASPAREDSEQSRTGRHDTLPLQEANINSTAKMDTCISPGGTLHSVEDLYDMATADLNERIQQAVQQVELKFADHVQRLEDHTASLSISASTENVDVLDGVSYHSQGSRALRKEMLSDVSQKVGDLDARVNQMESLVSYKLVDIESKVKELSNEQGDITQAIHQPSISQGSKEQGNILTPRTSDVSGRNPQRRHMESEDDMENVNDGRGSTSTTLVDRASIVELRRELQAFGMRYHELNGGLLTDFMGQMREAKLMLFGTGRSRQETGHEGRSDRG
ncbi:hypothetical protein BG011_002104 [Mortierella polycephala]|uniref:Uncharacterized protein n=1 Tax=Mortierella polycephala TaxID=41804 RepID=A0A9P6PFD1_9FUNG|nr:hypothetical protein BG011_002104 [Mortierella polycephala]